MVFRENDFTPALFPEREWYGISKGHKSLTRQWVGGGTLWWA